MAEDIWQYIVVCHMEPKYTFTWNLSNTRYIYSYHSYLLPIYSTGHKVAGRDSNQQRLLLWPTFVELWTPAIAIPSLLYDKGILSGIGI